jgi:hypothetical protein
MRGVYTHVSDTMRADLKEALQARWEASLRERSDLPALPRPAVGRTAGPLPRRLGEDDLPNSSQRRARGHPAAGVGIRHDASDLA